MEESIVHKEQTAKGRGTLGQVYNEKTKATQLSQISKKEAPRTNRKSGEFDRVLGGGIVDGSLILIGGDPGIGKSTILLQTALTLAEEYNVLYVSGEESLEQIKMRADRITNDAS